MKTSNNVDHRFSAKEEEELNLDQSLSSAEKLENS